MTSSTDSDAIPLPQKDSPIQYPKYSLPSVNVYILRPIIPTKPLDSGFFCKVSQNLQPSMI